MFNFFRKNKKNKIQLSEIAALHNSIYRVAFSKLIRLLFERGICFSLIMFVFFICGIALSLIIVKFLINKNLFFIGVMSGSFCMIFTLFIGRRLTHVCCKAKGKSI